MNKYLVWIERKPGFTGDSIEAHRQFLAKLKNNDALWTAGGFTDQSGGAYVITSTSIDEAWELVKQDPMYTNDETVYKIKQWNIN